MPPKKDPYQLPAMKVLGLYSLLLFTGRKFSLPQLAEMFRCSKQTVLRMVEQVELSRGVQIDTWMEDGRKWYRARTPQRIPNVSLDVESIQHLILCRDMVWHLLPRALREEVNQTIGRTTVLLPDFKDRADAMTSLAESRPKGSIDYTSAQSTIENIIRGMREHRICEVSYQAHTSQSPKTLCVAPLRLIAFKEGLYVRCRLERAFTEKGDFYDPTLAVHRIRELTLTDRRFDAETETEVFPESGPPGTFGFMPGESFRVRAAIGPAAAAYVGERTWSADQQIEKKPDGGIVIEFTATSRLEVIAWVLGFGTCAELLAPEDLRAEVAETLRTMAALYA